MTYKFKTNINCLGCVSQIEPVLNSNKSINNWRIDMNSPQHVLTIDSDSMSQDDVKSLIHSAGFNAQPF